MKTHNHNSADRSALIAARDALVQSLLQVDCVLVALSREQYVQSPVGPVHSSVASHVRHSLDHVRAFIAAIATGELDYDARERGTEVERDPSAAHAEISRLIAALRGLSVPEPDALWTLAAQVTEGGALMAMRTNPLRELVFVLSHTIHHSALIGVMARGHGITLPAKFGYAPATLSHESSGQACAH
jgi:uncharacterized damage-inducible protein DinB